MDISLAVNLDDSVAAIQGVSNVAAISGANAQEASRAMYNFAQALSAAKCPRIQIEVPTSTVQMEYICGKKPAAMLEMIADLTKRAKALCSDVEFIADDATRSDEAFLYKAIATAIEAGAKILSSPILQIPMRF